MRPKQRFKRPQMLLTKFPSAHVLAYDTEGYSGNCVECFAVPNTKQL